MSLFLTILFLLLLAIFLLFLLLLVFAPFALAWFVRRFVAKSISKRPPAEATTREHAPNPEHKVIPDDEGVYIPFEEIK